MTTDRSRTHAEHPDDEHADGEWGTQFPFSQPGDWVALAEVSHGAKALYYVYCGHVNKKKNGEWVWPTQKTLANILRVSEKTVRKWIVELESIRAIIVTEVIDPRNGHKRLVVTVNQAAPDGYDGYIDYKTYYRDHKNLKDKVQGTLVEAADASTPRTPPVKSTGGPREETTGGTDQQKHEPPVKSTEGQGPKTTAGPGEKVPSKKTNSRTAKEEDTHTSAAETDQDDQPETETGVCVDDQQRQAIAETVRVNVIDRAPASVQKDDDDPAIKHAKIAIFKLAITCFEAGASIDAIDTALSSAINSKTTHPYTHGTEALNKLLAHKQDNTDPLGATKTEDPAQANPWIDPEDGQEWPHRRLDNRPCGGQACADVKGKKYVAVKEQLRDDAPYDVLGAVAYEENGLTCQTCKEAYKKEGLLT